jgi:hypothetical protein
MIEAGEIIVKEEQQSKVVKRREVAGMGRGRGRGRGIINDQDQRDDRNQDMRRVIQIN